MFVKYYPVDIEHRLLVCCVALLLAGCESASTPPATPRAMLQPVATGWQASALLTIGTAIDGYQPAGKPDGLGLFTTSDGGTVLLLNHELNADTGAEYRLANGARLRGARISRLELDPGSRAVQAAGLAFDAMYDRTGQPVTRAAQLNETGAQSDGLSRLCSARAVRAGQYHFSDDIFFSGEEVTRRFHPQGGTLWALDVNARTLWPVNAIGRGAWENVTPLQHPDADKVALLASSDMVGAPLYLYVGNKGGAVTHDFLDRNGLRDGTLYCWRTDNADTSPRQFHGSGAVRAGRWVALAVRGDAAACGVNDACDAHGYLNSDALQRQALEQGCFSFTRPEDLHDNPANPLQAAFASTGKRKHSPEDAWGTVYLVDTDFSAMRADIRILHDADGLPDPGAGIRNPDNLTWAGDGMLYVQEDRADDRFAEVSAIEAGIWQLDPATGAVQRIAVIDRSAVWPANAGDAQPGATGAWESSGIIDATGYFETAAGETLLLTTVQAHTLKDGAISDHELVEGGQLLWLSHRPGAP